MGGGSQGGVGGESGGGVGGGEAKQCDAVLVQYMYSLRSYTCKRIFPVHIIINGKGFLKFLIIYSKPIYTADTLSQIICK